MGKYLKADLYRMISSKQCYIGIFGMALIYYASGFQTHFSSVCASFTYTKMFSTIILAYAFCTIPFSSCFVEDAQNHFWYLSVQKGTLKKYVWSKILVCFLSGVMTMVIGVTLFALVLRINYPFFLEIDAIAEQLRVVDSFGFLLYENTALFYFIGAAFLKGLLGGIFALLSAYLSLYEKNRLFTIAIPIIAYYFLVNFLTTTLGLSKFANPEVIFSSDLSYFQNPVLDISYGIIVALVVFLGMGMLIQRKVRGEIYGA